MGRYSNSSQVIVVLCAQPSFLSTLRLIKDYLNIKYGFNMYDIFLSLDFVLEGLKPC